MQLINTSSVAKKLSVSSRMVRILLKAGELPAVRVGRCLRFRDEDVDAFIRRRYETNRADPNQQLIEGEGE